MLAALVLPLLYRCSKVRISDRITWRACPGLHGSERIAVGLSVDMSESLVACLNDYVGRFVCNTARESKVD